MIWPPLAHRVFLQFLFSWKFYFPCAAPSSSPVPCNPTPPPIHYPRPRTSPPYTVPRRCISYSYLVPILCPPYPVPPSCPPSPVLPKNPKEKSPPPPPHTPGFSDRLTFLTSIPVYNPVVVTRLLLQTAIPLGDLRCRDHVGSSEWSTFYQ